MGLNAYDDAIEQLAGGQPPVKTPDVSPWDSAIDQTLGLQDTTLRVAVDHANLGPSPEQIADSAKIAAFYKLPPSIVAGHYPAFKAKYDADKVSELLKPAPAVSNWLTQGDNAALAKDDHVPLTTFEKTLGVGKHLLGAGAAGVLDFLQGLYGAEQAAGEALGATTFAAQAAGKAQATGRLAERLRPSGGGLVEQGIYGGIESLGNMAPSIALGMATGGAAALLGAVGVTTGGQTYAQAREQGQTTAKSGLAGTIQGLVEVGTEFIPAHRLLGDLAAKSGLLKTLAHQLVPEIVGEEVATVLQDLNEWAFLPANKDRTFADYLRERPSAAAATAISTIVAVGATTATAHAGQRMIERLGEAATESKTVQRSPEKAAEVVQAITADTPVEHLYADVQPFAEYWQSRGEDPAVRAEQLTGDPTAYATARQTGEALVIPTANYVAQLAATEHNTFFSQELRLAPEQMNAREAVAFEKAIGTQQTAPQEPSQASAVFEDIQAQLIGIGTEPSAARTIATWYEHTFGAFGRLVGMDPATVYAKYGYQFLRNELGRGIVNAAQEGIVPQGNAGESTRIGTLADQAGQEANARTERGHHDENGANVQAQVGAVDIGQPGAQTTADVARAEGAGVGLGEIGGVASPRVEASTGPVNESATARAARREQHYGDVFATVLDAARRVDPAINPAALKAEFDDRINLLESLDEEYRASGHNPQTLLKAIAKYGGLSLTAEEGGGYTGELRWVRESPALGPFGMFGGVKGVFRKQTTGTAGSVTGLSMDDMVKMLSQDAEFSHIQSIGDLLVALEDVARLTTTVEGTTFPGTKELAKLAGMQLDRAWWRGAIDAVQTEGDVSFDPETFYQSQVTPKDIVTAFLRKSDGTVDADKLAHALSAITHAAHEATGIKPAYPVSREAALDAARAWVKSQGGDVLDTGEVQPRLPGETGAVREQNIPTPTFEAPFSLTSPTAPQKGKQTSLFQGQQPRLSALHNLSAENLVFADKMGGLAVPSVGVVTSDLGIKGMGDITLIGRRSLVNPSVEPVHDADVYSKTFPRPEYDKVRSADAQKVLDRIKPFAKAFDDYNAQQVTWDDAVNSPDPQNIIRAWLGGQAAKALYLSEHGKTVEPVLEPARMELPWVKYLDWTKFRELMPLNDERSQDEIAAAMPAAKQELIQALDKYLTKDAEGKRLLAFHDGDMASAREAAATIFGTGGEWINEPDAPIPFNYDWKLTDSHNKVGTRSVNREATRKRLDKALKGQEAEFTQWVNDTVLGMFGQPFLRVSGRKMPYALPNIVDYMTGPVRAQEQTMTYGEGKARAAAAKRFTDLEQMRRAASNIADESTIKESRDEAKKLIEEYRNTVVPYYGEKSGGGEREFGRVWEGLDASMKAMARWARGAKTEANMRTALAREGFRVSEMPSYAFDDAVEAGKSWLKAPVPYFEAKPQRAVSLNEFAGAVIPKTAPAEVRSILDKHGIPFREYRPGKNPAEAQQSAVVKFRSELARSGEDVLFQSYQPPEGASYESDFASGVIRFGKDRQFTIELFKNADLSTIIHESSHSFLEVMRDLSPQSEQIARDLAILENTLFKDAESETDKHERFARASEAYLMEGKAPSAELRPVFARFRAWLVGIYKHVRNLNVTLTPEVRAVFDRLYATDEQIKRAEAEASIAPMIESPQAADILGMTADAYATYRDQVQAASDHARDELMLKLVKEQQREQQDWWKSEREKMRATVAAEFHAQPVYRAESAIRYGTHPDGTPLFPGNEPVPMKLAKADLANLTAEELTKLRRRDLYRNEGGLSPDAVAELFGYSSGDELVRALIDAPAMRQAIDAETDRRMKAEHGDMLTDPVALRNAAQEAVHGQYREQVIRAELKALTKGIQQGVIPPAHILNAMAQRRIAGTAIRDLRPGLFLQAAQRASLKAFDLKETDRVGAVTAKQQELLNLAYYREAIRVRDDVDARVEWVKRHDSGAARARLGKAGTDYLDQWDGFQDRYEFKSVTQKVLDRRTSLRDWVAAQEAEGLPVELPQAVLDDSKRVNYRAMTVDEFQGVTDAMKQIVHLAQLKHKLLTAANKREFDAAIAETVSSIREKNVVKKLPLAFTPKDQRARTVGDWFASHTKISTFARALDGYQDGGPMWEYVIRPLNEAATREAEMKVAANQKLHELMTTAYTGRELAQIHKKVPFIPAINDTLSKEHRLAVALNWGNEGNRQRLRDGRGWSDQQVQAILDTLDQRDWTFVQGVWDFINSYWPDIAAKQQRVTGLVPEKVEATPVVTRFGTFPGGYYPLVGDSRLSARAGALLDVSDANLQKQAAYVKATTRRGHTEARAAFASYPVKLNLDVLFGHVEQVIHDLSHHEALIDVGRILGNGAIQKAIYETKGDAVYKQFKSALRDVAFGIAPGAKGLDKSLTFIGQGTTIAGLAWNAWTATQQPAGVFNGMERVGPSWVAKGITRMLRDVASFESTARWITEKSPMMAQRGSTQQREISELRNRITHPGGWFDNFLRTVSADKLTRDDITGSYFSLIEYGQRLADYPTWIGQYEKSMAAGEEEQRAVALADQAVLDSQSGGQIKDLAEIQRGGPGLKLFTMFYSYGNLLYNQTAEAYGKTNFRRAGSVGQFLVNLSLLYVFPAAMTVTLGRAFSKGNDDDSWVEDLAKEIGATALNTMVLVREFGGFVRAGNRGYEGPTGTRAIATGYKLGTQIQQGEADRGLLRASEDLAGILFRLPLTQVQRSVDGFVALQEGRTHNPLVLLSGAPREH